MTELKSTGLPQDQIIFDNWSTQINTAAIFQIIETGTVKDNKYQIIYGLRVNLIFGNIEDETAKGVYIPLKMMFAAPDLAFKFVQKHLTPIFNGTAVAVMLVDKSDHLIGTYDLTKVSEDGEEVLNEESPKLNYPQAAEGTIAVN